MKTLKDASGRELPYDEVWEIAFDNAWNNGEDHETLNEQFNEMDDDELLQWATDEDGNFSEDL